MWTVVRSVLAFVSRAFTYLFLCIAVYLSLGVVQELVHTIGHGNRGLSVFGEALDDGTSIPGLLTLALVSWFVLDELLVRRRIRDGSARAWRATVTAFVASAIVTLTGIMLFWVLDGYRVSWSAQFYREFFFWVSLLVSAGMAAGAISGIVALRSRTWPRILAMCVPIAVVIAQAPCREWATRQMEMDLWQITVGCLLHYDNILLLVGGVAIIGAGACWLENRLTGHWGRMGALAFAALWACAALANMATIVPFHIGIQYSGPRPPAQTAAAWLVGGVWPVAIVARLVIHWRAAKVGKVAVVQPEGLGR
jgi:hypothetical protein